MGWTGLHFLFLLLSFSVDSTLDDGFMTSYTRSSLFLGFLSGFDRRGSSVLCTVPHYSPVQVSTSSLLHIPCTPIAYTPFIDACVSSSTRNCLAARLFLPFLNHTDSTTPARGQAESAGHT